MDLQPGQGRLAIIAGGGKLPAYVAQAAKSRGENPFIIALKDDSREDWSAFDHATISIGDYVALTAILSGNSIGRIVMSGGVTRRPEWREIHFGFSGLLKLPSVVKRLVSGGDNSVLTMVIGLLEQKNCRVIGAQEIAPDLLAVDGPAGKLSPDDESQRDIHAALHAARLIGSLDIGQGAVATGGRVVALEGAEGTDSMLTRVADLKSSGRISSKRRGVLVKICKPQQDLRVDLPSIGLATLSHAFDAGLAGVALEAGRSLLLDRDEVLDFANRTGMFVYGISPDMDGAA
jgi:hypothetical protein